MTRKPSAAQRAAEVAETCCPRCDYDEAEGGLVTHCAACQHKIVVGLYEVRRELLREDRERRQMERALIRWVYGPGNIHQRIFNLEKIARLAQSRKRK